MHRSMRAGLLPTCIPMHDRAYTLQRSRTLTAIHTRTSSYASNLTPSQIGGSVSQQLVSSMRVVSVTARTVGVISLWRVMQNACTNQGLMTPLLSLSLYIEILDRTNADTSRRPVAASPSLHIRPHWDTTTRPVGSAWLPASPSPIRIPTLAPAYWHIRTHWVPVVLSLVTTDAIQEGRVLDSDSWGSQLLRNMLATTRLRTRKMMSPPKRRGLYSS